MTGSRSPIYDQLNDDSQMLVDAAILLELAALPPAHLDDGTLPSALDNASQHSISKQSELDALVVQRRETFAHDMQLNLPNRRPWEQERGTILAQAIALIAEMHLGSSTDIKPIINALDNLPYPAATPHRQLGDGVTAITLPSYDDLSPRLQRQISAVVFHELLDERIAAGADMPLPSTEVLQALIAERRDDIAGDMQAKPPIYYDYAEDIPTIMESLHAIMLHGTDDALGNPVPIDDLVAALGLDFPGKPRDTGSRQR